MYYRNILRYLGDTAVPHSWVPLEHTAAGHLLSLSDLSSQSVVGIYSAQIASGHA